jgi:hypothetical protein
MPNALRIFGLTSFAPTSCARETSSFAVTTPRHCEICYDVVTAFQTSCQ